MTGRYPLSLDLAGRAAVVVGGGPVAARRAQGLVDAGAVVTVVAPYGCEQLAELAAAGLVAWARREYNEGDLDGAWLAHTATGDPVVDAAVAAEAERLRVWCVRADVAGLSAAWTPARASVAGVEVAVTAGGDPRRAVRVRNAVQSALETGGLPLRRTRSGAGHVALIGGGPGDPGLITTRGRQLLAQADVVVVDRLAPRALLELLDDDVEVIEAGKAPHAHTLTQDQINAVLVDRAQAGLRVARLKGGDPYVLGRGGEEALACLAAGVDVEVVPGVTSAIAGAAAGGIPVTHRGLSRQFTVVSAHDEAVDWPALAAVGGTLVLLMGVGRLREAAAGLVAAGRAASTPVGIVERATLPDQRTTVGDLGGIADLAAARGVESPAVIVVGEVAALSGVLGAWDR